MVPAFTPSCNEEQSSSYTLFGGQKLVRTVSSLAFICCAAVWNIWCHVAGGWVDAAGFEIKGDYTASLTGFYQFLLAALTLYHAGPGSCI